MKFSFNHIKNLVNQDISLDDLSEKLIQLGHENTFNKNIIDIEFTPNRGDCLSLLGITRDLGAFYKTKEIEFYENHINKYDFNFKNKVKDICPNISFLKIDVDNINVDYLPYLKEYFDDLGLNKNNFFTDISNYLSYELGLPTHCYDASFINNNLLTLEEVNKDIEFETLLDKRILLTGKNYVFTINNEIINLAGIIGGKRSSCSKNTTSVIIECAYFKPESIIGKSIRYDIQSDASYKFERGVDPGLQEKVLRRFAKIVEDHTNIKSIELYSEAKHTQSAQIELDEEIVNSILGTNISKKDYIGLLNSIGLTCSDNLIKVPSYRSDIKSQNDLAEEVARIIGYDNIPSQKIKITSSIKTSSGSNESSVRHFLVDQGFNEVINFPFTENHSSNTIKVDNPLDSNKSYLRTRLKDSLVKNLIYNERRQKDIIKMFEISDIYNIDENGINSKRILGLIASGRLAKNYEGFNKIINEDYLKDIFKDITNDDIDFISIDRNEIDSKSKYPIFLLEIEINNLLENGKPYVSKNKKNNQFEKYKPISEFPSTYRDLSFLIKDETKLKELDNNIMNFANEFIKEVFMFDYYLDKKVNHIKAGYRIIFQSNEKTLTDIEIDTVMDKIIRSCLEINSIDIPGLN
tara:strand:+ start:30979 stop:32883 length:1905 start_codon:yes stop_codon:yes gene_type:complete